MRVAFFPPEQQVADVPAEVVREGLLRTLQSVQGFAGAYFCADPASGKGLSVTLWQTEAALRESEDAIRALAQRTTQTRIPDPSTVETFEVVYTAQPISEAEQHS
jgi:heme-degrading monooxygenase HmoA